MLIARSFPAGREAVASPFSNIQTSIMLALIGGIGDGTACFVIHELMKPGPLINYIARFGPGIILGALMIFWLQAHHQLTSRERISVMFKVTLGWALIVPLLSWSSHQSAPLFWGSIVGASVLGVLAVTAALTPYFNDTWSDRVLLSQWVPLSIVTGVIGSLCFVGIMQFGWLHDWPGYSQRILANVLLFTPWTASLLMAAWKYVEKEPLPE
ncbi:hypothetical protein BTA51_11980 [Hahella sp. CCB-MM4]|uniref:hypothetical protein n=1 Tax=Hahella sp. (strain CCB-MM4) TaxID=1926491 RepID=UPI000B9ADD66|nr:hypothetical protein [Hahella sp. CCB-MM4]OZG73196.1 hypothetical protein BTA51_11980 [Hahella sp. CCB-MM4]